MTRVTPDSEVNKSLVELETNLEAIIHEIKERAPKAQIILIDYLPILPEDGSCPALPMTEEQIEKARSVARQLTDIFTKVANDNHIDFIPSTEIGEGKDVCAEDSWIQPYTFKATPSQFGEMAYNPQEKGMKAIAEAIIRLFKEE